MSILDQSFEIPEDFDVQQYLASESKDQPVVRARLQFVPEAAHIVAGNRILWESIQENSNGSLIVTLTAPDLPWLASMVMSFGTWVTAPEPPALRIMMRDWLYAIGKKYISEEQAKHKRKMQ